MVVESRREGNFDFGVTHFGLSHVAPGLDRDTLCREGCRIGIWPRQTLLARLSNVPLATPAKQFGVLLPDIETRTRQESSELFQPAPANETHEHPAENAY